MLSFGFLCVLLGLGYWIRRRVKLLQRLYLPASVIGGLLGLFLLQTIPFPQEATVGWVKMPVQLINIVFACLFLGTALPPLAKVWNSCSRQLAYGQIVAWGQYAVGCVILLLLIKPLFALPDLFAGIMPVGFEGGHGTAGGMGSLFSELGYPEMKDYALVSATGGIMGATLVGMAMVNWAVRKGYVEGRKNPSLEIEELDGMIPKDKRPATGKMTVKSDVIGSLSLHLVFIGTAILLGWLMKEGLAKLAHYLPKDAARIFSSFPLFPLCMLGGVLVQLWADRFDTHEHMDADVILRIQNCALDFLVVAAIATIRLDVVAKGWIPILIVIVAGILWNLFCLIVLARRAFRDAWFERGIAEMGQSMGVTATGLLLLRTVDPNYETEAAEAFAAKQLLHEPIMGGGLWTNTAIPLLVLWGAKPILWIALSVMLFWGILLLFLNRKAC